MIKNNIFKTRKLVMLALLTAIVIVLQLLAITFPVYPFKLTLVLVPIVIGAALVGPVAGLWLGGVFGMIVIMTSPDVPVFMTFNPLATIFVILLRGLSAGFIAGVLYRLVEMKNKTLAVICAAIVCPIVNTGLFVLGLQLWFLPIIGNVVNFFIAFVLFNFIIELIINLVLCPTIVRLIQLSKSKLVNNDVGCRLN